MGYFPYRGPDDAGFPMFPTQDAIAELNGLGGDFGDLEADRMAASAKRQALDSGLTQKDVSTLENQFNNQLAQAVRTGPTSPAAPAPEVGPAPEVTQETPIGPKLQVAGWGPNGQVDQFGRGMQDQFGPVPDPYLVPGMDAAQSYEKPVGSVLGHPTPERMAQIQANEAARRAAISQGPMTAEDFARAVLTANITHPGASYEGGNAAIGSVGTPVYRGLGGNAGVAEQSLRTLLALNANQAGMNAEVAKADLARAQAADVPERTKVLATQAAADAKRAEAEDVDRAAKAGLVNEQVAQIQAKNPARAEMLGPQAVAALSAMPEWKPYLETQDPIKALVDLESLGALGRNDPLGTNLRAAMLARHHDALKAAVRDAGWSYSRQNPDQYAQYMNLVAKYFPDLQRYVGTDPESAGEEFKAFMARPPVVQPGRQQSWYNNLGTEPDLMYGP